MRIPLLVYYTPLLFILFSAEQIIGLVLLKLGLSGPFYLLFFNLCYILARLRSRVLTVCLLWFRLVQWPNGHRLQELGS